MKWLKAGLKEKKNFCDRNLLKNCAISLLDKSVHGRKGEDHPVVLGDLEAVLLKILELIAHLSKGLGAGGRKDLRNEVIVDESVQVNNISSKPFLCNDQKRI